MKYYNELPEYVVETWRNKNYDKEVKFILDIFKKQKVKPSLIADVACGAGSHASRLMKKGFNVIGVDLYDGMIKLAKKRVPKLKVLKQDMRKLKLPKKVDCILTMFNVINHLENYKDFEKMLKAYGSNLNDGGLIIFDSFINQGTWLPNRFVSTTLECDGFKMGIIDNSRTLSKTKGYIHQVFAILKDNSKKPTVYERDFVFFIYDLTKIKELIKKLGFKLKIYYDFSLTSKKKKFSSLVFVLQK